MAVRFSQGSLGLLLLAGATPLVAYSQVYLTEDQATAAVFPGEAFTRKKTDLSPNDIKTIEKLSGETVRNKSIVVWVSSKRNMLIVDQVLGKHEFITFAVGINPGGKVKGIEILEYRETYGQDVKKAEWRQQFVGKDKTAPLKLKQDIVNISGATLSSSHVTAGVRRLLQTYELVHERL